MAGPKLDEPVLGSNRGHSRFGFGRYSAVLAPNLAAEPMGPDTISGSCPDLENGLRGQIWGQKNGISPESEP